MTALKGDDSADFGSIGTDNYKNVRYAYFTFNESGVVEEITALTDDINKSPVRMDDLLQSYYAIQQKECGSVVSSGEPDLCSALQAALNEFNNNPTGDPDDDAQRERKIIIISSNQDTQCNDNTSICDSYRDLIYGTDTGEGIGVIMVNIDFPAALSIDLYETCITYNDPDRIVDVTNEDLEDVDIRDSIVEDIVKVKLCESEPSPSPTTDPSADPTEDPTIDPTTDPTIDPTRDPTTDPTADPITTAQPTETTTSPSLSPSPAPTGDPTSDPTAEPTSNPTSNPTYIPTFDPTMDPTYEPTEPTYDPTIDPTSEPTTYPTANPTEETNDPTTDPTRNPTQPTSAPISTFPLYCDQTFNGTLTTDSYLLIQFDVDTAREVEFILCSQDSQNSSTFEVFNEDKSAEVTNCRDNCCNVPTIYNVINEKYFIRINSTNTSAFTFEIICDGQQVSGSSEEAVTSTLVWIMIGVGGFLCIGLIVFVVVYVMMSKRTEQPAISTENATAAEMNENEVDDSELQRFMGVSEDQFDNQ